MLPDPLPAGRSMLFLGSIERMDTAYINGTFAGASAWVENPRVYFLPEGVLKPGRNVVAIRVLKTKPDGGFLGKPEELRLVLGDKTSIPLAGKWKGRISVDARPPHPLPIAYENWPVMLDGSLRRDAGSPSRRSRSPARSGIRASRTRQRGYQYRRILPVMIADWRKLFAQGDFPFYIVSLPAFKHRSATPVDGDEWAETRESQAITAASVPNSCLAVTIDTGDADNIHSKDKAAGGRAPRPVRVGKLLWREGRLFGSDSEIGRPASWRDPTALCARRRRPGGEGNQAGRVRHRRRGPEVVLGRCANQGQNNYCLLSLGAEPQRSSLCLAVESRGDPVQRSRAARRSLPDRHMARDDRSSEAVLIGPGHFEHCKCQSETRVGVTC